MGPKSTNYRPQGNYYPENNSSNRAILTSLSAPRGIENAEKWPMTAQWT
jgi:hypothetical protein